MKLQEIIEEAEKEYLYHATYMPLIPSIKKEGLNPNVSKKSWDISGNYIYLSPDREEGIKLFKDSKDARKKLEELKIKTYALNMKFSTEQKNLLKEGYKTFN